MILCLRVLLTKDAYVFCSLMILTCLGSLEGSPSHWGHSSLPHHFWHLRKWVLHIKISFVKTWHSVKINKTSRKQRPNSWTKSRRISSQSRNLLRISTVQLLYNVKEKGEKPDKKKPWPYPRCFINPFRNFSRLCPETSTTLSVHELGFGVHQVYKRKECASNVLNPIGTVKRQVLFLWVDLPLTQTAHQPEEPSTVEG